MDLLTSKKWIWVSFILCVIGNALDYFLTKNYLKEVGTLGELNPIVRYGIEHWGSNFMLIKFLFLLVFGLCIRYSYASRTLIAGGLAIINFALISVVLLGFYCNFSVT